MRNSIYPITLALLWGLFSGCSNQSEQRSFNPDKTACQQLDEIDLEMLNLVKQIKAEYRDDEVFIAALNDAQTFWTQYKNRQVKAVFPLSPKNYDYDVGECKCEIYRDLTVLRVKELQKWIDGVAAEVTCRGTYQVAK